MTENTTNNYTDPGGISGEKGPEMKNVKDMIDDVPEVLKNAIDPVTIKAALSQPEENFAPVPWEYLGCVIGVPTSDVAFGNVVKTENHPRTGCPVLTIKLHDEVFAEINFPINCGEVRFWVSSVFSASKDWSKELVTFYIWELQERLRAAGFPMN
jgi:hypothetical protein